MLVRLNQRDFNRSTRQNSAFEAGFAESSGSIICFVEAFAAQSCNGLEEFALDPELVPATTSPCLAMKLMTTCPARMVAELRPGYPRGGLRRRGSTERCSGHLHSPAKNVALANANP